MSLLDNIDMSQFILKESSLKSKFWFNFLQSLKLGQDTFISPLPLQFGKDTSTSIHSIINAHQNNQLSNFTSTLSIDEDDTVPTFKHLWIL